MSNPTNFDLLKVAFIGNVDDGKSTLIGRLFHDTDSIFEDQRSELERSSARRGETKLNLALFTDGLRAEREQGITIDIAYRYFATERRKFIVVDCPGHFQYTRNMITGCSTVDAVVVLIDAENYVRHGLMEQTKRHLAIASLLGIRGFVVGVNKMDLVGYDESVFRRIADDVRAAAMKVGAPDLHLIPISAVDGDNVVARSEKLPWYPGATLLTTLETLNVGARDAAAAFRFPVQRVIRGATATNPNFRGYAGRIASGTVRVGDEIAVGVSGFRSKVRGIHTFDEPERRVASAPDSIVLTLEDEIDVSRGDLLAELPRAPRTGSEITARICWLGATSADPATTYLVKHHHRYLKAKLVGVRKKLDISTLVATEGDEALGLNEIGEVSLKLSQPVAFDAYAENRTTGSVIVIDPRTNQTVGAGLFL
ncbi:MAG: 50S ribosome-binding GTPase [Bdellovibrionales bacterium]|nr:50S ribosome-binding GTPase [Bdellovibrionales bacterium]